MIKKKLKLSLKKQVISRLSASSMSDVKGGYGLQRTRELSCNPGPFCNGTLWPPCVSQAGGGVCNLPPSMDGCPGNR